MIQAPIVGEELPLTRWMADGLALGEMRLRDTVCCVDGCWCVSLLCWKTS